jgi:hypothetical protein
MYCLTHKVPLFIAFFLSFHIALDKNIALLIFIYCNYKITEVFVDIYFKMFCVFHFQFL